MNDVGLLDKLDFDRAVEDKDTYEESLDQLQLEILKAELKLRECCNPALILFEGWDAAGKGGAIKRLTEKLDPRGFHVWSIGVPTHEENLHHYLWRFWSKMPERGRWAIFDRSWYGRVLVERVDGLVKKTDWRRAYRELNEFERFLVDDGMVLVKVFLAITKDEQLTRFKEREADPYKQWKIGAADWHNRENWNAYVEAAEEMFEKTSTSVAPWTVIGANHKWHARLEVLRTVLKALRASQAR